MQEARRKGRRARAEVPAAKEGHPNLQRAKHVGDIDLA